MTNQAQNQAQSGNVSAKAARRTVRPRVDVFENEQEYLVVADLPGVANDAVDVRFEAGELRIEGRRGAEVEGRALAQSLAPCDFVRAFAMPDGIDAEKIEAKLAAGVLEVHLPKVAARRPRKIEVRGAA